MFLFSQRMLHISGSCNPRNCNKRNSFSQEIVSHKKKKNIFFFF